MTRALIIIDMQLGFDDRDFWGQTANPDCLQNVERLIGAWQRTEKPIVVVRHDSRGEAFPLHPSNPGNALVDAVAAVDAALLVSKDVNSATRTFDLDAEIAGVGRVTRSAEELMQTTALVLQAGGFAAIATTDEVVAGR